MDARGCVFDQNSDVRALYALCDGFIWQQTPNTSIARKSGQPLFLIFSTKSARSRPSLPLRASPRWIAVRGAQTEPMVDRDRGAYGASCHFAKFQLDLQYAIFVRPVRPHRHPGAAARSARRRPSGGRRGRPDGAARVRHGLRRTRGRRLARRRREALRGPRPHPRLVRLDRKRLARTAGLGSGLPVPRVSLPPRQPKTDPQAQFRQAGPQSAHVLFEVADHSP
ncbi:MAG: hypothetical protein JWO83_2857 [Caulobacteraceae bacterium]|nr:hypothetical protein [Caulobacteraceae bacterium]